MESRLAKPSGLPRPIVPSDRPLKCSSVISIHENETAQQLLLKQAKSFIGTSPFENDQTVQQLCHRRSASDLRQPHRNKALRFVGSSLNINVDVPAKLYKSINTIRPNSPSATCIKSKISAVPRLISGARIDATTTKSATTASFSIKRPLPSSQQALTLAGDPPPPKKYPIIALNKSTTKYIRVTESAMGNTKEFASCDYKSRFTMLQDRFKELKVRCDNTQDQLNKYSSLNDQYKENQSNLIVYKDQLKNEVSNNKCLRKQVSSYEIEVDSLTLSLSEKMNEIQGLRTDCKCITDENEQMRTELHDLRLNCIAHVETNKRLDMELREKRESLFRSNRKRRELHNMVMDLRGNIRVFCRVRPPLATEEQKKLCGLQYLEETSLEISIENSTTAGKQRKQTKHDFSFDQVFHSRSSQEDIFEQVSPLIQSAMDGYNVCIFAYGQTGSGKTFTMEGDAENIGIIPRTVDFLFDCVQNYRQLGWEYTIQVTFLEIYNEVLYDLLSNEPKDMDIRMVSAKVPTEIYVSNITEMTVTTAAELHDLMRVAKTNRATAATASNERSSRSHAVTRLQLVSKHNAKAEILVGTINLVDLAGSESPKISNRMEETKKINKSLSELTNVIMALTQRHEHIPYRNSKLTHLLMPCLGGNSKTLMFINVAPFQDCFIESIKSLRFALSVNSCKMVKTKPNKMLNSIEHVIGY